MAAVTDFDLDPIPPEPLGVEAADDGEKHTLPFWLELPLLILAALVIAVIIKTFFFQAFWIPSSSMEDTLQINDRVMVNKLAYRLGDLQRGQVRLNIRIDRHVGIFCLLGGERDQFLNQIIDPDILNPRVGLSCKTEQLVGDLFTPSALGPDLL